MYNGCKNTACLCSQCDNPCCDNCLLCIEYDNAVDRCDRAYSYGGGELVDPLSYLWEDRDKNLRNHGKAGVEE
jgi:hypothetical protein